MSLQYQHKKGIPKMIKDLKYGANAHLRQSLLDISQIQNLNKIYLGRKQQYRIEDQKLQPHHKMKQNSELNDQVQFEKEKFVLSPEQNLQIIKRQRITDMMKDKMNQMFKQQQVRKFKMRKPVLHRLLQDFRETFRVQQQPKFRQALKNSEKNLEHIKINSKKRISSQYIRGDSSVSRSKFVSISTGKPVADKNYFPTFTDFVQGKYKIKQQPFIGIDINKINNYFSMVTEPNIHEQKKNSKDQMQSSKYHFNRQIMNKTSLSRSRNQTPLMNSNSQIPNTIIPVTSYGKSFIKSQITPPTRVARAKSAINPDTNFIRSQQSSKKIISAMLTYHNVKRQKNQQCDSIVGYLKKDRPLTSHIRRKNYKVIGKFNIQDVSKYRQKSQEQRVKILEQNYNFYISLLKIFQHCKEQQIQGSLQILNRLRQFFQAEYIIFRRDAMQICQLRSGQINDFGVSIIYENLMDYAKKEERLDSQNQEDYEML